MEEVEEDESEDDQSDDQNDNMEESKGQPVESTGAFTKEVERQIKEEEEAE